MATWEEDIVQALEILGGSVEYDAIYSKVSHIRSNLPESWKQIIQRNIQDNHLTQTATKEVKTFSMLSVV